MQQQKEFKKETRPNKPLVLEELLQELRECGFVVESPSLTNLNRPKAKPKAIPPVAMQPH